MGIIIQSFARSLGLLALNEISLNFISPASLANDPPMWRGIERLQSACLGMILLDMETIFPVGEHLFTLREAAKAVRMGPRRRREFTAARVALKRLARQLDLVHENKPDREIETLGPDDGRPCLRQEWNLLFGVA